MFKIKDLSKKEHQHNEEQNRFSPILSSSVQYFLGVKTMLCALDIHVRTDNLLFICSSIAQDEKLMLKDANPHKTRAESSLRSGVFHYYSVSISIWKKV